jgi:hypothetical protein
VVSGLGSTVIFKGALVAWPASVCAIHAFPSVLWYSSQVSLWEPVMT